MTRDLVFPTGLTLEAIDAFCEALHAELLRQTALLKDTPLAERDLDRKSLRTLFDAHGFGEDFEYLGVSFDAPVQELIAQLQAAEDEQLGSWQMLLAAYPEGKISLDSGELISAELPDDWDPND